MKINFNQKHQNLSIQQVINHYKGLGDHVMNATYKSSKYLLILSASNEELEGEHIEQVSILLINLDYEPDRVYSSPFYTFVLSLYDLEKEKLGEDADLYKYLNDVKFNPLSDFDYAITFSN